MNWRVPILTLGAMLAGCGGSPDVMPLAVGKSWRYSVSAGFNEYVAEAAVVRKSAVDGVDGFVLEGPMGESFLAWNGDLLVAERMGNMRAAPALPLAVNSTERVRRSWKGWIMGYWGRFEGEAVLNQAMSDETVAGRKVKVVKSDLVISNPKGKSIRLLTLFEPGVGLVYQKQWHGGENLVTIELIGSS